MCFDNESQSLFSVRYQLLLLIQQLIMSYHLLLLFIFLQVGADNTIKHWGVKESNWGEPEEALNVIIAKVKF